MGLAHQELVCTRIPILFEHFEMCVVTAGLSLSISPVVLSGSHRRTSCRIQKRSGKGETERRAQNVRKQPGWVCSYILYTYIYVAKPRWRVVAHKGW